jgi:hypothetical protein
MPTARGRLVYDPRVIVDGVEHFDPWWTVLECAPSLLDPHRAVVEARHGVRLTRPRWGAHLSVVSGEAPLVPERWGWRRGEEIEFLYAEEAETDGVFFWLRVLSEELLDIRAALGLVRQPRSPLHLTLGRRKGK